MFSEVSQNGSLRLSPKTELEKSETASLDEKPVGLGVRL